MRSFFVDISPENGRTDNGNEAVTPWAAPGRFPGALQYRSAHAFTERRSTRAEVLNRSGVSFKQRMFGIDIRSY